jgi:RimJ/RimL family protein N-acetyltransferase
VIERLTDGAPILIRPIRPEDKGLLESGLRYLSDTSVQRRFLAPKRSFSRAELRYLTELDGRDHVALIVVPPDDQVSRAIAVARYVRDTQDRQSAEMAIVVADDWQRRGLGTMLAERLADQARATGITRFTATTGSDNLPAQRLMRRISRRLDQRHTGYGVSDVVLDLAA